MAKGRDSGREMGSDTFCLLIESVDKLLGYTKKQTTKQVPGVSR